MFDLKKLKAFLDAVVSMRQEISDEVAGNYVDLYANWDVAKEYHINERISYKGKLYKVLQDHTSQLDWTPDVAVSLYATVLTSADPNEVLAWVQPDSTNPYMTGDKVLHNNKTWICDIDNNVWEPGAYGWSEIA